MTATTRRRVVRAHLLIVAAIAAAVVAHPRPAFSATGDEWSATIQALSNAGGGGGDVQFTMHYGVADGATDDFDDGIDYPSPPGLPDPGGRAGFFLSPTEWLSDDYRGASADPIAWILCVTVPPSQTWAIKWVPGDLPAGGTFTCQEPVAGGEYPPTGTVHDMRDTSRIEKTAGLMVSDTFFFVITYEPPGKTIDHIAVEGQTPIDENSGPHQYECRAYYTDGTDAIVAADGWQVGLSDPATIDPITGQLIASEVPAGGGTATVTATLGA